MPGKYYVREEVLQMGPLEVYGIHQKVLENDSAPGLLIALVPEDAGFGLERAKATCEHLNRFFEAVEILKLMRSWMNLEEGCKGRFQEIHNKIVDFLKEK